MNIILSAFFLSVALLTCAARAGDTPWKTYGEGDEQHRIAQPYIISYPADFEVDSQSDWGDAPRPHDPQVKSIEHVMMLHNPEHTLTVQACDYDMIWLKAEPEGIRQDAVLQREVERIYAQYLRLNQEAGGHAPVSVTPEERSRRTEHHFFNTPDFSLL